MKTDDRDEALASILDEAVSDIGVDPKGAPVATTRGVGRVRVIAAVAAAAVFVAGVVFASGQFGRDRRPGDAGGPTVVEGSFAVEGWRLERPAGWMTAPFDGCGTLLPRGLIVSNFEFEFLDPEGQVPSCGDRIVLAGFPTDGVVIDLEPAGARGLPSSALLDTPFPIAPSQLVATDGVVGGPRSSSLPIVVDGGSTAAVRMWVGPAAVADDIEAAHQILGSMRIEGADRWVDELVEFKGFPIGKSHEVRVGVAHPEEWEIEVNRRVMVIDAPNPILVLASPDVVGDALRVCGGPLAFTIPTSLTVGPRLPSTGAAIAVSDASESWSYPKLGSRWDALDPSSATTDRMIGCRGHTFRWLQWAFAVERRPILVDVLVGSAAERDLTAIVWSILEGLRFPVAPTPSQAAELPLPIRDGYLWGSANEHGEFRISPITAPVEMGVVYRFEVPHCGLDWITDFDGSFWEPILAHQDGPPPSSVINGDIGTIELVSWRSAIYTGSDGTQVSLTRTPGPIDVSPCD